MKKTFAILMMALIGVAFAQERRNSLLNRNMRNGNRTGRTVNNRPATPPAGNPAPAPAPAAGGEASDLNFNQTPVDLVFETYGKMVGRTVLKDPAVPSATITLKSEPGQKLTESEQIEAIEIILEMNGIHLENYGEKFVRALPRKDARKEGIPLIMDPETRLGESGKVVSMMIPFKNISTEEAQKALEGFKSNSGILLVFERTNSILVTDTEQNINRMLEIARAIDIASPVTEVVEYIQIKNASATEIKTVIDNIVQESMKEQEKNGKQTQNRAVQQPTSTIGNRLLRPGQSQPQAPVNQASLVMTVSDADRGMIRGKVVTIADERSNKILIITSATNMKFFKEVIAALDVETTPDTVVKVYRLKYADAEDVSDMINDLIGNSTSSKSSGKSNQNQNAKKGTSGSVTRGNQTAATKKPANQRSGETQAGELNKDNTTVLADKRINGLVVMTNKELVPTVESIVESMDIKLSQVLIETVIIEVGLGDGIKSGMDWVQKGRTYNNTQVTDNFGNPMYYTERTTTTKDDDGNESTVVETINQLVNSGYSKTYSTDENTTVKEVASALFPEYGALSRSGLANNYVGNTSVGLAGGANNGQLAYEGSTNILGSAFNFIFDSDELGLKAILQASKTDSRTKYIASPVIMTLDNKEATIEATSMRYLFKGYTYSGSTYNGSAVPDYEQKELGITIKVTPKINPNGTVMLTLEEEYSQAGGKQAITGQNGQSINAETTVTRKMSADALLENNQTVIFAGLTQTSISESESGIPFLKDIPWIGKWLFGSVENSEDRSELLVFMTPYVLDDADAAEAEAIRRKKALSDPRAWDDHGWSASKLADPVSRKEMMRRLKDEWKKQDDERKTKIAIEKAKVERAKALEKMTVEERKLWLEMHKDELEEEKQEELEKKMLDEDSQEELKKLAEKIRREKLEKAEKALKQNAEELQSQNERGRLDAEKAAKAAAGEKPPAKKPERLEEVKPVEKIEEVKPASQPKAEEPKAEEPKAEEDESSAKWWGSRRTNKS